MRKGDSDAQSTIIRKFLQDQEKTVALLCNELPVHEGNRKAPKWWQGWDTLDNLVSCKNYSVFDVCIVQALLNERAAYAKRLAYGVWRQRTIHTALPWCRAVIRMFICFHKRYLLDEQPVCETRTSVVYFASDCEGFASAAEIPREKERVVMLKFMTDRGEFEREVAANSERVKGEGVGRRVVGYMAEYDGDVDAEFAKWAEAFGFGRYCVVMERACRCASLLNAREQMSVCLCCAA